MEWFIGLLIITILIVIIVSSLCVIVETWEPYYIEDIQTYLQDIGFSPIDSFYELEYYKNGRDAFNDILKDMSHAEKSINISMYSIKNSDCSKALYEELLKAVKRGVKVTVCMDSLGSSSDCIPINDKNANVLYYNPLSHLNKYLTYRNHDKYWKIVNSNDTVIYLASFVLRDSTLDDWIETGLRIHILNNKRKDMLNTYCIPFYTSENDNYGLYSDLYYNALAHAQEVVYIANPYFLPPDDIINLILEKSKQIRVYLIVLSKGDHPLATFLSKFICKDMKSRSPSNGLYIYDYKHKHVHTKSCIYDRKYVLYGSGNLDYRSLFQMHEIGAFIKDEGLYGTIKSHMEELISKSELVSEKCNLIDRFIHNSFARNEIVKQFL